MWTVKSLRRSALGVSASRRTDIPALFPAWFAARLAAGVVEYIPAGPPRTVRRSISPEDVTHFTFWSKWPRPFFRVLDQVRTMGYPVLWNVTITGLGGSPVEPRVPTTEKAVAALLELSTIVSPGAIQWRYDPIFVSQRYPATHHEATFRGLAERLAGHVDRVAVSFVTRFARRVMPNLQRYEETTGDVITDLSSTQRLDLLTRLEQIGRDNGLRLTLCCEPALQGLLSCPSAGCNNWEWACRVYPGLAAHRALPTRPTREGCTCSQEFDIGVYDTCTLGCVYSYGTCNADKARQMFQLSDPEAPCILPVSHPRRL